MSPREPSPGKAFFFLLQRGTFAPPASRPPQQRMWCQSTQWLKLMIVNIWERKTFHQLLHNYEETADLTDQCEDDDCVLPTASSYENLADLTVQSEDSEDSDGDEINTQLLLDAHAILVRNNHEYRPRADPGYAPLFCFHDYTKCEYDNRELVLDIRNRLDACREDFKILMTEEWRIDSKLLYKTHLSLEMLENNLDMLADDMMSWWYNHRISSVYIITWTLGVRMHSFRCRTFWQLYGIW